MKRLEFNGPYYIDSNGNPMLGKVDIKGLPEGKTTDVSGIVLNEKVSINQILEIAVKSSKSKLTMNDVDDLLKFCNQYKTLHVLLTSLQSYCEIVKKENNELKEKYKNINQKYESLVRDNELENAITGKKHN